MTKTAPATINRGWRPLFGSDGRLASDAVPDEPTEAAKVQTLLRKAYFFDRGNDTDRYRALLPIALAGSDVDTHAIRVSVHK